MTEATETDELLVAQREIRHLKDTITALREQMEVLRAEHDDAVQAAHATSDAEVRQLKDTVTALRENLEESEERGRQGAYEAEKAGREEMRQLQETISALRDRLEAAGAPQVAAPGEET